MEDNLFRLPPPIPHGAVFIGPTDWLTEYPLSERDCLHFPRADLGLQWLQASSSGDAAAVSRLVFLHQDAFAGEEGTDDLVNWLESLNGLRAPYLPIFLHGDLPADPLVRFFRAGLFDALVVPLDRSGWVNMLIRAERRLEIRQQGRLILATSGRTQDLLRNLRRQLGDQTARSASEMLRAQESLEAANRQLNEAMAELSLLYRFGRELSTAGNWDEVLREILKSLAGFTGARGSALILRSAPGGSYSPRQTWQWDESAWDKVIIELKDQVDTSIAESLLAPGVFKVDPGRPEEGRAGRRIIALPLEHQDIRLGFLLLLLADPAERDLVTQRYLPFLQAVQVVLSEEVASAQLLDRIRDIGAFNTRVLETVSSAIWVIDENGRTVFCNRAGQQLLTGGQGCSTLPEDILFQIGRGRADAPPDGTGGDLPELFLDGRLRLNEVDGMLLPFLRDLPDSLYRGEGLVARSDGTGIPVVLQTSSMPGNIPDQTWLVVVAEDLRERRKLEAERLRSDQLEGLVEMSATLAHEIRNPLMGLSAQAELLADQLPTGDKRSRYIEVITAEVDRINDTITRMLNFVRPYEPARTTAALDDLGRDSIALVQARAQAKAVTLEFLAGETAGDHGDLVFHIDAGQIKQVLLNLLINGVDAAPDRGHVSLSIRASDSLELSDPSRGTHHEGPGVLIEVRDDGPGFAEGDLARIFRPFYTTKSSGTGLGLAICHKIVAAHDGQITAGRALDHTFFRVLLPRDTKSLALEKAQNKEQT
jgi:two-component system nitrogen regulation sensor histidine kinase GlnL